MILLLHADPLVARSIQDELGAFPIFAVRSVYTLLAMISDPRYELLLAQKSLVDPWLDCIEGQRPAMPIIALADKPIEDEWTRRTLRNAVIGLSERWFLEYLASTRPRLQRMLL